MCRLLLFLLFLPSLAFAANGSDIGQISSMVSELRLNVPRRITLRTVDENNRLILSSNFNSNIIVSSISVDGTEKNKIGIYNVKNKSEKEITLGKNTETVYLFSPE